MGTNKILNTSEDFRGAFFLIALFAGGCLMIPTGDDRGVTDQLGNCSVIAYIYNFLKNIFRQFNVYFYLYQGGRLNMVVIKLCLLN